MNAPMRRNDNLTSMGHSGLNSETPSMVMKREHINGSPLEKKLEMSEEVSLAEPCISNNQAISLNEISL